MKMRAPTFALPALLATALLAVACGESREEKFEKAMKSADVAKSALESARKELGEREKVFEKAQAEADAAQSEVDKAQQAVASATTTYDSARIEVARWADDAAVTRLLQQRLLDEKSLEKAAISARVEQGTAILEGSAPSTDAAARAADIARETPGVADVRNSLTEPLGTDLPPEPAPPAAFPPEPAAPAEPSAPVEVPVQIETPPPSSPEITAPPADDPPPSGLVPMR
jgi:osmotically-inducible protein OsmY